MSKPPFKTFDNLGQMTFFAMTGFYGGSDLMETKPKTSAQKVKDLEAKNKKLIAEVKRLKEDIASLQRILSQ